MSDRFAAYSFVDRVIAMEKDGRVWGSFAIAPHLSHFPAFLLVEAVGQLAAWAAMQRTDFALRPVAALASEVSFEGDAQPGQEIELNVEIGSCDEGAVVYDGAASYRGSALVRLRQCVGPMQPAAEFDAPERLRQEFGKLSQGGAVPYRFQGVEPLRLGAVTSESAGLRATVTVPTAAPFFTDHFPRKPVLPATLLLDAQVRLALAAAEHLRPATKHFRGVRASGVKVRRYVLPGQTIDLAAEVIATTPIIAIAVRAQRATERIASACLEVVPEERACSSDA